MNVQLTSRGRSEKTAFDATVNEGRRMRPGVDVCDHPPKLQLWDSYDHRVTLFLSLDEAKNLRDTLLAHLPELERAQQRFDSE